MKNYTLLALFFLLFSTKIAAQSTKDSLWTVWEDTSQADTTRLSALHNYILNKVLDSDPERAVELAELQMNLAIEKKFPKETGNAYNVKGRYFYYKGELDSALVNFERAQINYEKAGATYEIASLQNNLGNVYLDYGNIFQALNYYHRGLIAMEAYGDVKRQADILTNIGVILDEQGDYSGAIRNYRKSSEIYKQLEQNSGYTIALINLGTSTMSQGDSARIAGNEDLAIKKYKQALDYKFKSLEVIDQLDYKWAKVYCLHDLGMIYHKMGLSDTAISYLSENIALCKQLDEFRLLASSYSELATIYIDKKDFKKALSYGQLSLNIAQEKGIVEETRDAAEVLYLSREAMGRNKLALKAHKLYIKMRDSLSNIENQRSLIQQEYKYEYEKKAIADSLAFANEQAVQKTTLEKAQVQRLFLTIVLLLTVVFSLVLFNRIRLTRKQKETIENQNLTLQDLNENLEEKVTDRTKELRASDERYTYALEASNDGIWDYNVKEDALKFSPAIYTMLGYEPYEFEESRNAIYSKLHPEEVKNKKRIEHDLFITETNEDFLKDEYRMLNKEGAIIWIQVKGKVVEKDSKGNALRIVGTHTDITASKLKSQEMLEAVLKTEDAERSRIAKDIHDGLQQTLTISYMNYEGLKKFTSDMPSEFNEKYTLGKEYMEKSIQESRSVAHSLMPQSIIEGGILVAFQRLIDDSNLASQSTEYEFAHNLETERLPNQQIEITLYRILQESLNNIFKYAKASKVTIQLKDYDDIYMLMIEDNGVGFDTKILATDRKSLGFRSMKNRLDAIQGHLDVSSIIGKGTTVLVEIDKVC